MTSQNRTLFIEAYSKLRTRIMSGKLQPGEKINEVRLSEELGISRTPLREALFALVQDGVVTVETNKGFRVATLTESEVSELYPILWTLEGLALKSFGARAFAKTAKLRAINEQIKLAKNKPSKLLALDQKWHQYLIEGCSNLRLVVMISDVRDRLRRYERVFLTNFGQASTSYRQHQDVIFALETQDLYLAIEMAEMNWRYLMELILTEINRTTAMITELTT